MKIIDIKEAFVHRDGDLVYDHIKVILQKGRYFYARVAERNNLQTYEDVWPQAKPQFTPAPDLLPQNSCVKRPSLLDHDDTSASAIAGLQILTEIKACEVLRKRP